MTTIAHIPDHYLGVWQRKHLENSTGIDNSSIVYWLQTPLFHADIRIPADRPAFKNKSTLQDFTHDELKNLTRQQGFAGITSVTGNSCQWIRHIDYQPPRHGRDIGYMQFNGKRILETGIEHNYAEIWEQLPDSLSATFALRFVEENLDHNPDIQQAGILVVSGDYFIFVRDRAIQIPLTSSLDTLLTEADFTQHQLITLLDFEVSFGRLAQAKQPWLIQHSTLPFREGESLFTESTWAAISQAKEGCIQHEQAWNGMLMRRWLV